MTTDESIQQFVTRQRKCAKKQLFCDTCMPMNEHFYSKKITCKKRDHARDYYIQMH